MQALFICLILHSFLTGVTFRFEFDPMDLTNNFAKAAISRMEEWINKASVAPITGYESSWA